MYDYPLSAKSSKKVGSSSSQFKNTLLSKSACQNLDTKQLNKKDYEHILVGQRIFIELYYKGNVTKTAYDPYIQFMGGTLYRRLNPKVTIFLTNPDEKQIGLILERVKKTCPNCKVISILWLQHSFRERKKVAFDEFVIESKPEKVQEEESSKIQKIENQLQQFLKNIGQDVQTDFKQFLKSNPIPYFQVLNKNHNLKEQQFLPATVFQLPPNKKQRQRLQNPKKKRKGSIKIEKVCQLVNQARQSKSMGGQALKKAIQQATHQDQTESQKLKVDIEDNNKNLINTRKISNIMQKYLIKEENINEDDDLTVTIENMDNLQKKQIMQIINTASKGEEKKTKNSKFYSQIYKKKKEIQIKKDTANSQYGNRFTFSNRGSFYQNIPIKMPLQIQETISNNKKTKANQLHDTLSRRIDNRLNIISNSKMIAQKINEINKKANQFRSITFQLITIQDYLTYRSIYHSNITHEFYYLLNPKKLQDKILYYYLSINNAHPPSLVNYRLIQQIQSYNLKIKDPTFKSPVKMQRIRFRFMNKIKLLVDNKDIVNKKIVFLQSYFDREVIKKIVSEVGGIFITQEQYLLGKKPDLIVTNKFGLPQKGVKTMKQDQLWSMLLKTQGDLPQ